MSTSIRRTDTVSLPTIYSPRSPLVRSPPTLLRTPITPELYQPHTIPTMFFRRSTKPTIRRARCCAVMPTSSPLEIQLGLVSLEEARSRRDIIYRPVRLLPTPSTSLSSPTSSPSDKIQQQPSQVAHKLETKLISLELAASSRALRYRGL
ncbi:hypothetical protein BXZ70DRAFT_944943 [Cristinia sonorae]|uniref:Uncharacterized protein n=1 Tax=Cristinia sonorae TaxID=1940300 RepID=A0A8K0ULP4_9AGAR|nr:hypothetical protein BXZ70DRAFT_944943 [Cristinia sonorae]